MKYAVNFYNNKGQYDGVEIEANSLTELCDEVVHLAQAKKLESIAEVTELDDAE